MRSPAWRGGGGFGSGEEEEWEGGEGGGGGGVLQSVAHTDYAVEISRIYITVH